MGKVTRSWRVRNRGQERAQASFFTDVISRAQGPTGDTSSVWNGQSVPASHHLLWGAAS